MSTQQFGNFRIQFNFEYKGDKGKKLDPKSNTVPDMSLTVRQLLQNHTRGIDNKVQEKQPLYFDIEVPTIKDITDVKVYRDLLKEQLEQTNKFIKDDLEAAEKARLEKEEPLDNGLPTQSKKGVQLEIPN